MTPKEFFQFAEKHNAKMMDMKFCDLFGTWQHCSYPIDTLDESIFSDGLGFDGSSIRGWQQIHESDMLAVCDPDSAKIDPFFAEPTVSVLANIVDVEKQPYGKCPRTVAKKAAAFLKKTGIADQCFIGPEPEFFIFDEVRYEQNQHTGYYQVDSNEAAWNSGRYEEPSLGSKVPYKGGYFPVSPADTHHDLRGEMVYALMNLGIRVEAHHHEVATAGQAEIDMEFCDMNKMCDWYMWYKYAIKNVARQHGKTVTFMPKPVFDDNGSGMHSHISLWKGGDTIMAGDGYAGMSEIALKGIAGILKHGPAILAFGAPTTNSYRRLVPGFEAPVNLVLSARNRSAACRIPMYSNSPKAKRVEFRCPDPAANGYLLWPAMLMAMIDGIESDLPMPKSLDKNIYELQGEELASIPKVPGSLAESIDALEADSAFLTKGGVFDESLIQSYINWKRSEELDPMALRPHPFEFQLYYDC